MFCHHNIRSLSPLIHLKHILMLSAAGLVFECRHQRPSFFCFCRNGGNFFTLFILAPISSYYFGLNFLLDRVRKQRNTYRNPSRSEKSNNWRNWRSKAWHGERRFGKYQFFAAIRLGYALCIESYYERHETMKRETIVSMFKIELNYFKCIQTAEAVSGVCWQMPSCKSNCSLN